jgi:hypothetical protein
LSESTQRRELQRLRSRGIDAATPSAGAAQMFHAIFYDIAPKTDIEHTAP